MPKISRHDFECSFFTFSKECDEVLGTRSVCGVKPVAIKSGKCLFHTTGTHDHDNEWIDCYAGCLKHDEVAQEVARRNSYRLIEAEERRQASKEAVAKIRVPVPSTARLIAIASSYENIQDAERLITKKVEEVIKSRRINQKSGLLLTEIATVTGLSSSAISERLRQYISPKKKDRGSVKSSTYTFAQVIRILEYVREWDKEH